MVIKILFSMLVLLGGISNLSYAQDKTETSGAKKAEKFMDDFAEKTEADAKWNYNPFRKTDTEVKMIGWMDPNNFITSLWVGDVLSKYENLTDPNWQLDNAYIFYTMKVGTEINPISFTIKNFTFRMGIAYFADIQLLGYSGGVEHKYGADIGISDYMRINFHFDFIWNDNLKFRWIPLYHECAHVSGDYQADDGFDPVGQNAIPDLGIEGMGFELYYNWGFFTFYGGINFTYQGIDTDAYATLFGLKVGMDMRIPVWGKINFITGLHFGANYDLIQKAPAKGLPVNESYTQWYPTVGIGIGFEFDRYIIGMKYTLMRSRHMISYTTMDERIGIDVSIFF